ncbi:hypothetical protein [uncultured Pelagimonas sp.]|uniref:hypothetical protein n=1 Tax=uncultured Pelagimonas sp. TaxID=1618102 RepID=UPI002639B0D6|nr:hypothetical protein [uncultured Pelagimonas sp.]
MAIMDQDKFNRIFGAHKPTRVRNKPRRMRAAPLRNPNLSAPAVVQDGMDAMQSMADGLHYDSKSAYYRSLKDQGLTIAEEKPEAPIITDTPAITGHDVKEAVAQSVAELGGGAI